MTTVPYSIFLTFLRDWFKFFGAPHKNSRLPLVADCASLSKAMFGLQFLTLAKDTWFVLVTGKNVGAVSELCWTPCSWQRKGEIGTFFGFPGSWKSVWWLQFVSFWDQTTLDNYPYLMLAAYLQLFSGPGAGFRVTLSLEEKSKAKNKQNIFSPSPFQLHQLLQLLQLFQLSKILRFSIF